jgi:hypothetical protein
VDCGKGEAPGEEGIGARLVSFVRTIALGVLYFEEETLLWKILIFPSHGRGRDSSIAGDF